MSLRNICAALALDCASRGRNMDFADAVIKYESAIDRADTAALLDGLTVEDRVKVLRDYAQQLLDAQ